MSCLPKTTKLMDNTMCFEREIGLYELLKIIKAGFFANPSCIFSELLQMLS
jgi:hypothetical protein